MRPLHQIACAWPVGIGVLARRNARLPIPMIAIGLLLAGSSARADEITFEYFRGTSFSAPMTLTVEQVGEPSISFTGHYSTRPLQDSPYYVYRFSRWKETRGWVVEFTHHKAYLDNPQQGVDAFEVTHGYNLITANRAWHWKYFNVMAGGGLVVTFPHSTIRGRYLDPTIDLSGVTGQVAVSKRLQLARHVFAVGEAKLTRSWASVPVVNGSADVPNTALHLIAGLGVGR
jgi:hypothetical protein